MYKKAVAVAIASVLLLTAMIYTSPSVDSIVESQPPDMLQTPEDNIIVFPMGGGYDENFWMQIRSNFSIVEASINLIGLDALDSVQPGLYNVITTEAEDSVSASPVVVTDIYNDHFIIWEETGDIVGSKPGDDIFVRKWDDQGSIWEVPVQLSDNGPNTFAASPSAATDASGNVHVVWAEYGPALSSGGPDSDIYYSKWDGSSWSAVPILISDDVNDGESTSPEIAVDAAGNVYIVWVDDGNIQASGNDLDIVMKSYDAAGMSWSETSVLSRYPNDSKSLEPAVFALNDLIHFAWTENGNVDNSGPDYDIVLQTYQLDTILTQPAVITTDPYDGDSHAPALAANDTTIFIVWQDDGNIANSGTDIDVFLTSVDIQTYKSNGIQVVSDDPEFGSSINPKIIKDNFENLYFSWEDDGDHIQTDGDWDIYYRILDKISFQEPELLTSSSISGKALNVSMAVDYQNHVQFVWEDNADLFSSGFDEDIYIKDIFFNYVYPSFPKLDIGKDGSWEWQYTDNSGKFDTSVTLEGEWLGLKLTSIVDSGHVIDGKVMIPFRFSSDSTGAINISHISLVGTATPEPPENLTIENENDMHVINHRPLLSWDFVDDDSTSQGRFEIEVGTEPGLNDMWDPTPAESTDTSIEYHGNQLFDGRSYYFKVRTADDDGSTWSQWSDSKEFKLNTAPAVTSLTPLAGTFDRNMTLFWAGEDAEGDELLFYVDAYYDGIWHSLANGTTATNIFWNTSGLAEQTIDFQCYATDGYENSAVYNPAGNIYIVHNTPPTIEVETPDMDTKLFEKKYLIEWSTVDPDEDDILTISLFYDLDKDPAEKDLIITNYPNRGYYEWDTTNTPAGEYFILGEVDDGTDTVQAYSRGTVIVGRETDLQPPRIISIRPTENAENVAISTDIKLIFDKDIDAATIDSDTFYVKDSSSKIVEGLRFYDDKLYELYFRPRAPLDFDTRYTVVISNDVRDLEGLRLDGNKNGIDNEGSVDDYSWSFRTMTQEFDTEPPEIDSTSPEADSFDNNINTNILINFNEPVEPSSLNSRSFLVITLNDMLTWDGVSNSDLTRKSLSGVVSYDQEHFQAIFSPSVSLEYNTTYVVTLTNEISDLSDNRFNGHVFSFKTAAEPVSPGSGSDGEDSGKETIVEVFKWDYFYYVFIILLVILILIATTLINRRIIQGPMKIRDVFIIYNDGRLLYHYRPKPSLDRPEDDLDSIDESAVSSMLTAIQDFVKDSFKHSGGTGLNELQHGTLRILIEHGDKSYVAVVSSGGSTAKIRNEMKSIINDLNTKYGFVLKDWDGNMNSIAGIDKLVVPLLTMEGEPKEK
jgi:hypothetical protein